MATQPTLTEQLDALVAEHGLASIGLIRIAHSDGSGCFWSVDVQAEMPNGERAIGTNGLDGDNPSTCLAAAIEELNRKRAKRVALDDLLALDADLIGEAA